jgi:hypothetical protein
MAVAVTLLLLTALSAAILAGKSSIGDFVWHDTDADGIADAGELGINGVVVELWEDTDGSGDFDPTIDTRLATSTTLPFPGSGNIDDNGYYDFNAVGGTQNDPAKYLVVITDTNFLPGGALDGYVYTGNLPNPPEAYSGPEPRYVVLSEVIVDYNDADFSYALAQVELIKTAGNAPDGDIEYLSGPAGATTYHYAVTNTGEVALDLAAVGYGIEDNLCSPLNGPAGDDGNGYLDVGETWTYTCDASGLTGTITNTATVTGNPVSVPPVGPAVDLPGNDVVVTDTAVVDVVNPAIVITKTVYGGHDGGASCPGADVYNGATGDPVTYCFVVKNTGDTVLDAVVDDNDVNAHFGPTTLQPGETVTYHLETTVNGPLVNTATTTGTPVDENGVPLLDIPPVTDTDTAEVTVPSVPGAIGDFVWYDADSDGYQDTDEPGIPNVTVNLVSVANGINVTTTTGVDGGYIFPDLPAGTDYVVTVTDANGVLVGLTKITANQSLPSPTPPIAIATGEFYEDADFGYVQEPVDPGHALIGDTVFYDGDGDGIQDPGEPGMPGVTVVVTDSSGNTYTGVTDQNGNYLIEVPTGPGLTYTVSPNPATVDPAVPSSTTPDPHTVPPLTPGEQYLDADFGYTGPELGTIGNQIWHDTNPDGFFVDGAEPGIPGVTVDLIDAATGNVIATTVTDANGAYSFTGLPDGDYRVNVTDTANVLADYLPTIVPAPEGDNTNKNQPYPITLVNGAAPNDHWADFGYILNPDSGPGQGVIGDQIFFDVDGDGLFEPDDGDYGIAGVDVELLVGGVVSQTITSGSSGLYAFTGLLAGDYEVRVASNPTNTAILGDYVITSLGPNPGQNDNNQVDPDAPAPYPVTLPTNTSTNFTADFGYTNPGLIGDFIWWDIDGDGIQDPGEPGIPNVTVNLKDGTGATIGTVVTGPNGDYIFNDLAAPATYTVEIDPAEFLPGGDLETFRSSPVGQGGDPTKDSDFDPNTHDVSVPLAKGEQNYDIDGGFISPSSFEIKKFLSIDYPNDPVRTGDPISFTIRITNTGSSIIVTLPLSDTYNPDFMDYDQLNPPVPAPDSVDETNGVLTWDDVLPGTDQLLPGDHVDVVVHFIGLLDTTDPVNGNPDPSGETINHALVPFIEVTPPPTPGNPPGTFPPANPGTPPGESDDGVTILNPTSVRIVDSAVRRVDGAALLEWTTATESDILGFNILRVVNGQPVRLNAAMIEARFAGQSNGDSYSFTDSDVSTDALTFYRLEIVTTSGQSDIHQIGMLPPEMQHLFLPVINAR